MILSISLTLRPFAPTVPKNTLDLILKNFQKLKVSQNLNGYTISFSKSEVVLFFEFRKILIIRLGMVDHQYIRTNGDLNIFDYFIKTPLY